MHLCVCVCALGLRDIARAEEIGGIQTGNICLPLTSVDVTVTGTATSSSQANTAWRTPHNGNVLYQRGTYVQSASTHVQSAPHLGSIHKCTIRRPPRAALTEAPEFGYFNPE